MTKYLFIRAGNKMRVAYSKKEHAEFAKHLSVSPHIHKHRKSMRVGSKKENQNIVLNFAYVSGDS